MKYDPDGVFNKVILSCNQNATDLPQLFHDDVAVLLSMERLWRNRKAPIPLAAGSLDTHTDAAS